MEDDPRVIVGIPTYNNEETIEETLKVVLSQTRAPDMIVVCDKSSDGTKRKVREKSSEIEIPVVILNQRGDGVADAYNQMWTSVRDDYDIFITLQTNLLVDSDWIEGHVRIHREHPQIGVVTGGSTDVDREVPPTNDHYYHGRNVSFKRGVLETIDGWDSNFLRGEDWDIRIRLAGANIRSFVSSDIAHGWTGKKSDTDPYITFGKAKRYPTSLTFLAKYGSWYVRYHPSHVVHDLLSVGAVLLGAASIVSFVVSPPLAVLLAVLTAVTFVAYNVGHRLLLGGVDGSTILGPLRKQVLIGVAVLYAFRRLSREPPEWNMSGFDPEYISTVGL